MPQETPHPGPTLRELRIMCGLSLRGLASLAGTHYSHLAAVERGERQPSTAWMSAILRTIAERLKEAEK